MMAARVLGVHFSTNKDDWQTPPEVFDALHAHYCFDIDAAASTATTRLPRWYGEGGERIDALAEPWDPSLRYWCNPPYSRKGQQVKFVERAFEHAKSGGTSVLLLPARTDTKLFHLFIWNRQAQRPRPYVRSLDFVEGRIKFVGAANGAPFPSMIVTFGPQHPLVNL
jgi:site-specific DNA-methyltransferase (adenine-specific)